MKGYPNTAVGLSVIANTFGNESMDEFGAQAIADILGAHTWNTGGGLWLVVLGRADGRFVAIYDEAGGVYRD